MTGSLSRSSASPARLGEPHVCILAGAPFLHGGIERLTWEVLAALQTSLGDRLVASAALVGRRAPDDESPLDYEGPPHLALWGKTRFAVWTLTHAARWRRSTVLFCMLVNHTPLAYIAHRLFRTRYVVWVHGTDIWSELDALKSAALRHASLVLCSSDFTRERLLMLHQVDPERAVTVHPPVGRALLERAATAERAPSRCDPVILSVGRVTPEARYKGFDTVIRALPAVAREVPDASYRLGCARRPPLAGGGAGSARSRPLPRPCR